MRRTSWIALTGLGLLGTLAMGSLVQAAVIGFEAYDKQLGDAPIAVAVTPGDRIVAAVQATSTPVMGWFDTQDWRDDSVQRAIDGLSDIRCIEGAGDSDAPILLLGGDAVAILEVDDSSSPPVFSAVPALGLSGGSLAAMAWDEGRGVAYGADDVNQTLRWIPVTGAGGSVDSSTGWPLPLAFTPTHLALVDEDTLLVGGDDEGVAAGALIDLAGDTPSTTPLELAGVTGTIVAASADGGDGWLLTDDGTLVQLLASETGDDDDSAGDDDDSVGDDDDSAGDDDDSAGDDDDSAGDDDDSAGDDDDSAGDDDDSAGDDDDSAGAREERGLFEELVFSSDAPTPSVDLIARDGVLYALGGSTVAVLDLTGAAQTTFSLSGAGSALGASSSADGHLYVALEDLGVIAVLGDGPFLEITGVSDSSITSSDDLVVSLVAGRPGDSGTCTLTATVDGTINGSGTDVALDEELTLGVATDVSIPGADLEEGSHRLHLFCGSGAAVGRASLAYYLGDLEAPLDFTVAAGEGVVTASWTDNDDEAVISYDLLFSDAPFADGDEPVGSNADGTLTSPISVAAPTETIGEETLVQVVSNLTNGTTFYFAVAAVDGEGNRGPLTEVKSATPNVTGGVAAQTGDTGCSCEYPARGARPAALLVLPLMLLALARRRRPGVL